MFFSSSHIRVSQKVLEFLKMSWKSPGKSEKKSMKILESPGIRHKIFCGNPAYELVSMSVFGLVMWMVMLK